VPYGVLDFIDADGVDLAERSVFQTPGTTCSTASNTLSQDVGGEGLGRLFCMQPPPNG